MTERKSISVGTATFRDLIEKNNYYVDKTAFLKPLMEKNSTSVLFTRPRRFGKSLTMGMMKEFFCLNYENDPEYEARQKNLFKDLEISKDKAFCDEHMGKYPVISVSFKSTDDDSSFKNAVSVLYKVISQLFDKFTFLLDNPALDAKDRKNFLCCQNLMGAAVTDENTNYLKDSLDLLVRLLNKCYKEEVIVLIDEYDVPLQNAHANGFYREMINIFRRLAQVGKPDNDLPIKRCVFTGCLRISKESIFTGLNGTVVYSISSEDYNEFFGFTDTEVDRMLAYYGVSDKKALIKERYDGYNFSGAGIYNPWDVMYYLSESLDKKDAEPRDYWVNSSKNEIIYEFVNYVNNPNNKNMPLTFNRLLRGETVACKIDEEFSYRDLDQKHSAEQLLTMLYLTGYLTCSGKDKDGRTLLKIPNQEIHNLFGDRIVDFFNHPPVTQFGDAKKLYGLLLTGSAPKINSLLTRLFLKFLSVQDTKYEITHHAFVYGLLLAVSGEGKSVVGSQMESGDGYPDIMVLDEEKNVAAVLEFKRSRGLSDKSLNSAAERGLKQIIELRYAEDLEDYKTVWCYGIGCRGKKVAVVSERFKH